jgi:hypothetical protein
MYGLKIIMLRLFLLRYIERRQHHRMVLAAFTVAVTVTNSLSTYRPRRSLPRARSQIRFFLALFILSQTHHRQPQVGGEAVPAVRLDYFLFGFKEQSWSTGRDRSQAGLLGLPWSTDHITTYPIQPAYLPSHPANLSHCIAPSRRWSTVLAELTPYAKARRPTTANAASGPECPTPIFLLMCRQCRRLSEMLYHFEVPFAAAVTRLLGLRHLYICMGGFFALRSRVRCAGDRGTAEFEEWILTFFALRHLREKMLRRDAPDPEDYVHRALLGLHGRDLFYLHVEAEGRRRWRLDVRVPFFFIECFALCGALRKKTLQPINIPQSVQWQLCKLFGEHSARHTLL